MNSELSSQNEENLSSAADSTAKRSLPKAKQARGHRPGQCGRRASRGHSQPCKQLSYHPATGRVRKVVRHIEGPVPYVRKPALQHRLSVAQLADAALVVSRTKEFEGQTDAENPPNCPSPSSKETQPEENTAFSSVPSSRTRRMVRQASVDMDPSLG